MVRDAPARDEDDDRPRAALRVGVVALVLVIAHFFVPVHRFNGRRFGNVTMLDPWQANAFNRSVVKSDPSLVMIGDSQQFMSGTPEPNGIMLEGTTETLLPLLASGLDARYPTGTPRAYVRLAGSDYTPIEELATIALWFRKTGFRPHPVLIGLDLVAAARPARAQRPTLEAFWDDPAIAEELLASFAKLPEGAEAVKLLARPVATKTEEPWCDRVEFAFSRWSRQHNFYYGEPYTTGIAPLFWLQKAEQPVLDRVFGKRPAQTPPPQPTKTEKPPFIRALVRYLAERGIPAICYAEPRNPVLFPLTPALERIFESVRKDATEEGCVFIDAFHALRGPENWGYLGLAHDESHITPVGHRALADLLLDEGEKVGAWGALTRDTVGGRRP